MNEAKEIEDIYPLLNLQRELLLQAELAGAMGLGVVQASFDVEGDHDLLRLRRAAEEVVRRHTALRTVFVRLDTDKPRQVVLASVTLPWEELDGGERFQTDEAFQRLVQDERVRGFRRGQPMFRIVVAKAPGRQRLLISYHHAIMDGWSFGGFLRDLVACHDGASGSHSAEPPPFRQYVAWQLGLDEALAERHWVQQLSGPMPPPLAIGRVPSGASSLGRRERCQRGLDAQLMSRLAACARQHRVTLVTLVHAAWAVLTCKYSGGTDALFASVDSGRDAPVDRVEQMLGCLVRTYPVRISVEPQRELGGWLRELQATLSDARSHGFLSLSSIRRLIGGRRDVPFLESLVVHQAPLLGGASSFELAGGLRVSSLRMWEETGFPLTLRVLTGESNEARLSYDSERLTRADAEELLGRFLALLEQLSTVARVGDLSVLTSSERQAHMASLQGPSLPRLPGGLQLPIEARAKERPEAPAVKDLHVTLTRRALDARANALAWELSRRGVGPGDRVAVALPRDAHLVAALLAVLKAGAAYVPLDLNYPDARNREILADARPKLMLATPELQARLPGVPCLDVAECDGEAEAPPIDASLIQPESPAYLIYTSGTTGRPKGVIICHRAARALCEWARCRFSPDELRGTLWSTSICFDLSVFEIFGTLAAGGTIVAAEHLLQLAAVSSVHDVTLVNTVPSVLSAFLETVELPASVSTVLLAGEPLPGTLVERVYQQPGVRRVFNLYGPSEDTTYSTEAEVMRGTRFPAIGRPLPGGRAYVLDDALQVTPTGVPGMLYLGGEGVALGYWERPEETAAAFVRDPFRDDGATSYRTGDIVRQRPDGQLEYIGRRDGQIKLRGYRIERAEVQLVLQSLPAVRDAAVLVRTDSAQRPRLIAYVAGAGTDEASLKAQLRERLPEALVPSRIVVLERLPSSANGKLDERALPEPEGPRSDVTLATAGERTVASVWSEVLSTSASNFGRDDNFFDVGGDSLMLMRVQAGLRRACGRELPMVDLFQHTTVRSLGELLSRTEPASLGLAQADVRARERRLRRQAPERRRP